MLKHRLTQKKGHVKLMSFFLYHKNYFLPQVFVTICPYKNYHLSSKKLPSVPIIVTICPHQKFYTELYNNK